LEKERKASKSEMDKMKRQVNEKEKLEKEKKGKTEGESKIKTQSDEKLKLVYKEKDKLKKDLQKEIESNKASQQDWDEERKRKDVQISGLQSDLKQTKVTLNREKEAKKQLESDLQYWKKQATNKEQYNSRGNERSRGSADNKSGPEKVATKDAKSSPSKDPKTKLDKDVDKLKKRATELEQQISQLKKAGEEYEKKIQEIQSNSENLQEESATIREMLFEWMVLAVRLDALGRGRVRDIDKELIYKRVVEEKLDFPHWPKIILEEFELDPVPTKVQQTVQSKKS